MLAASRFDQICASEAPQIWDAVEYKKAIYVALDDLVRALGGKSELTQWARAVKIQVGDQTWELANGGDRLISPDGKTSILTHPVLVVGGRHFLRLEDLKPHFDIRAQGDAAEYVLIGEKRWKVELRSIESSFEVHRIEDLQPAHRAIETTSALPARSVLHAKTKPEPLPSGTRLLLRRSMLLDGVPHFLATDTSPDPCSFVVAASDVTNRSASVNIEGTAWQSYRDWFDDQLKRGFGLRRGEGVNLPRSVAVTIDLCWSMRGYEERFFRSLPVLAREHEGPISPVFFVSGRWLEQHPLEMHSLVLLAQSPGINVIWGLHSWAHPKAGKFMDDLEPGELVDDTLRLERQLLEWGVVPSVYYRFPGLIHDQTRLQTVLGLDLFPIDCDCWMALIRPSRPEPFYHSPTDGSIVLIHGNGNEPAGIDAFQAWFAEHKNWQWAPLYRFLQQEKESRR